MNKLLITLIIPVFFFSHPNIVKADFKRTKIAVLDFMLQGKGFETEDLGQIVAEWLITALVKEGRFDVVERRLLKKIIAEQQLSETGFIDRETTARLGKVLGVKVAVSGSVMRIQNIIEVNARIIDVESGSILAAESVQNTDTSQLRNLIDQMAQKIIKGFPLEGYVVNRLKEYVAIDLGRYSGVKLGMKFIAYKEGTVIKHPKTGEVLDVQKIPTGIIEIHKVLEKISEGYITGETEPNAIKYGQFIKLDRKAEISSKILTIPPPVKTISPPVKTKPTKDETSTATMQQTPKPDTTKSIALRPKLAILPWMLDGSLIADRQIPIALDGLRMAMLKIDIFKTVYSFYDFGNKFMTQPIEKKVVQSNSAKNYWVGSNLRPDMTLLRSVGKRLKVDAIFTSRIKVQHTDPEQISFKVLLVDVNTGQAYSGSGRVSYDNITYSDFYRLNYKALRLYKREMSLH